ncbi:MAG: hypothetical protein ACRCZO_02680 [Cetobacterium sp.]
MLLNNLNSHIIFSDLGSKNITSDSSWVEIVKIPQNIISNGKFITIDISIPTNKEFTTHTFPLIRVTATSVVVSDSYMNTGNIPFENIELKIFDGSLWCRKGISTSTSIVDNAIGNIFIIS